MSKRYAERLSAELLEGMGEPEPQPFTPSPFQEEALKAVLEGEDVIVVAPTGSGKTWIAEQAISEFLKEGRECWYTTPLKALSNQKYENFQKLFGAERVGLLTGERRENSQAPLIVATTEVLRNALYRAERVPFFIVLDEAHYLGDEERGTTWEEVIILAPSETRLLLLSATISNAEELAGWMEDVRGKRPALIFAGERPVPLRYGFITRRGDLLPLKPGIINSLDPRELEVRFHPVKVVELLEEKNLLPAIIFLPRRRDCDLAAGKFRAFPWKGREERLDVYAELAKNNPYLWGHSLLPTLIEAGVAAHHAGHLTGWKVAVERMLARGLLRAVFATTTLAAGLDVPARTVVLPTLLARGEEGVRFLKALEFQQMTGRAGRRGKDKIGFVIIVPHHRDELFEALMLKDAEPEPLRSSFRLHYYQILNLLSRYPLEEALEILERSFLLYQQETRRRWERTRSALVREFRRRAELLKRLGYLDEEFRPTPLGEWGLLLRNEHSLLLMEMIKRGLYFRLNYSSFAGWVASIVTERAPKRLVLQVDLRPLAKLSFELEALELRMKIPPSEAPDYFRSEGPSPPEAVRRAAAAKAWAEGMRWGELAARSEMEEGDLQRLLLQTAEILREIEDLPLPVRFLASQARESILRPPIL